MMHIAAVCGHILTSGPPVLAASQPVVPATAQAPHREARPWEDLPGEQPGGGLQGPGSEPGPGGAGGHPQPDGHQGRSPPLAGRRRR